MNPVKAFYQSTLKQIFPSVTFAFAYGSAVFDQQGRTKVRTYVGQVIAALM